MHNTIEQNIALYGRSIATVFPVRGEDGVPFAYTIGNLKAKKPELIILGLNGRQGGAILNAASELDAKAFTEGEKEIGFTLPCYLRSVNYWMVRQYMGQAVDYHGSAGFPVMQVFIADATGKFPWDRGCDPKIKAMQEAKTNA